MGMAKDWGISIAVVVGIFLVWNQLFSTNPKGSGDAPHFHLADLNGEEHGPEAIESGVAVLNFWFTSCGPCRHEIPEIASFHTAHPDVPVYGISVDRGMPTSQLAVRSKKLGINYSVLHDSDGAVAHAYGVTLFPTTFILNDGEIIDVRMGEVDRAGLERMVAAARGG
jgi:cytochrome c biogenesis protein CcmG, thiol:disulfide interchange protein DsbE